jgi:hypothetical protein
MPKEIDRYVVVHWVSDKQCSVTHESFVVDKKMLSDPDRIGLVKYADKGKKAPKGGWSSFPARVTYVTGKYNLIVERCNRLHSILLNF